jgi:hypothetical protein
MWGQDFILPPAFWPAFFALPRDAGRPSHLQRFGAKIQVAILARQERRWMQRTISLTPARVTAIGEVAAGIKGGGR